MRILLLVFLKGSLIYAMALAFFLLIVLLCYPYVSLSGRDTYGLTLKINTDDSWIKENKSNVPAFLPAA